MVRSAPLSDDDATLVRPASSPTSLAVPRLRFSIQREGGRSSGRTLVLDGERFRIGAHSSNDLVLDDRRVSRFHCSLLLRQGGWHLVDNASSNGTQLGGVRILEAILQGSENVLQIGDSSLRISALTPEKVRAVPNASRFGEIHGESLAMRHTCDLLHRLAHSDATVLIEGESGTGKELVAQELIRQSKRAERPVSTIDCSSIAVNLIESELFGHAKGAFTGAARARVGAFEAAQGGTVFLDEVGEMPLEMQPKLLRALEAREIRRTGENEVRKIDVRVIAATNRNLEREVNRGRFREDLYFRLSVFKVQLPPLRERIEDIPHLILSFLERMGALDAQQLFKTEVLAQLASQEWPGNVRELRNYVERAVLLQSAAEATQISRTFSTRAAAFGTAPGPSRIEEPFRAAKERLVAEFERSYLAELYAWAGGNVSKAAQKAKLDRMHLHRLIQRYGLRRDDTSDD